VTRAEDFEEKLRSEREGQLNPMPPPYEYPPYPPPPEPNASRSLGTEGSQPKAWLRRHLGCAIGIGCLAWLLLLGAASLGFFALVVTALRASDVYAVAMHAARTDPALIAELGSPIEAGWLVGGSVHVSGGVGDANISIPVSGPLGTGRVTAMARKSAGAWTFSELKASVDGRPSPIDLLLRLPP